MLTLKKVRKIFNKGKAGRKDRIIREIEEMIDYTARKGESETRYCIPGDIFEEIHNHFSSAGFAVRKVGNLADDAEVFVLISWKELSR